MQGHDAVRFGHVVGGLHTAIIAVMGYGKLGERPSERCWWPAAEGATEAVLHNCIRQDWLHNGSGPSRQHPHTINTSLR